MIPSLSERHMHIPSFQSQEEMEEGWREGLVVEVQYIQRPQRKSSEHMLPGGETHSHCGCDSSRR